MVDNNALIVYNSSRVLLLEELSLNKFIGFFAVLLCTGMFCACGESIPDVVPDDTTVVASSAEYEGGIAVTTADIDITESTIAVSEDTIVVDDIDPDNGNNYVAEPPLSELDLSIAVPDFLDEEQQLLYRRAKNVYRHLFGNVTINVEYLETLDYPLSDYVYDTNDMGWIYLHSQGRYQNWNDFMELVLSVFTEDFFLVKNKNNLFIERGGKLTFLDAAGGGSQYYNSYFQDEFELISESDTEIVFYVIGHYSQIRPYVNESYEERDQRIMNSWEYTDKFTIRMVLTQSGWRFDEFYDAEIDERNDSYFNS